MLISYHRGQGSVILRVKIRNSSVSTGAGLTGLTFSSSGLIISTIVDNEATPTVYTAAGSTIETITTLGTYAAPTATKCRFKEVDATNHKGIYEIQIADARFAVSNAKSLLVSISGATNAAECDAVIPLTDIDPYDPVRAALTALPNAAAEAAGGLYTRGTGAGQIKQTNNGEIDSNATHINNVATTSVTAINANVGTTQPVNFDGTAGSACVKSSLTAILGTVLTETAGQISAAFKKFFNVASPTSTMNEITLVDTATTLTNAPSDSSGVTTLLARLNASRAGYLDNLNVGGNVASHADIAAVNQSASKHILLQTVGQYEPGETYTIEMRTFSAADGSAVNADTTPTLTATGQVSGSLSSNLSAATNPAIGVYRWTYTPGASPTLEQIRFDGSATIGSATFTLSCYAQTIDEATAVFTATDQSHLTSIFNKLPTNNIADETLLLAAIGTPMQAGAVTLAASQPNYAPVTTAHFDTILGTPAASVSADIAAVKTDTGNLVTRITSTLFSGITSLGKWLGILAGSATDAGTLAEINSTTAGATYNNANNSLQAIRSHGDAAWATATSVTVSDKTGFKLASDGLNLVVPADPTGKPTLGTDNIVTLIGWFGAWSINEVDSTNSQVKLKNTAGSGNIGVYATSDDGATFVSGHVA